MNGNLHAFKDGKLLLLLGEEDLDDGLVDNLETVGDGEHVVQTLAAEGFRDR